MHRYSKRPTKRTYKKKAGAKRKPTRRPYRKGGFLRTIQAASHKPKVVVVRHTYENSFKTAAFSLYATTQRNLSLRFTPNNATIFDDSLIPPQFASSKLINPNFGSSGVTTYDDLLEYQTAYRTMQVLGTKYMVNVRFAAPQDPTQPTKYPIKIIMTRQTTPVILTPDLTSTVEMIEARPYTISRTMQQVNDGSTKGVNITLKHSARIANGIPKSSWIGHTDYAADITNQSNIGVVPIGGSIRENGIATEGDYVNLYIVSASSAALTDLPELLITLKTEHIVRYSEPSFVTDKPYPV
jgi:hypothetical protein